MTDDKKSGNRVTRPEGFEKSGSDQWSGQGPAKVILGPPGKGYDLEIAGVPLMEWSDDPPGLPELARRINRALAPLVAKAEAGEKMALVLKQYAGREDISHIAGVVDALAAWEKAKKEM